MAKSPAQLDREIASIVARKKPEVIARRKTADDKAVSLWSDGSLTWGHWNVIKGSPNARTDTQIQEALAAGWLAMGEMELYDADEVPRLIEVARKVARKGGLPGDVRQAFAAPGSLRPHWTVIETDRDGNPKLRVWRLPRMTHPGMAVWDYMGVRGRGRYHVMQELRAGGRGTRTYAPTGFDFNDLKALAEYLRETNQVRRTK